MLRRPLTLPLLCGSLAIVAGFIAVRRHAEGSPPAPAAAPGVSTGVIARLEALGYSEKAIDDPDPTRRGVTRNEDRAQPGVNYYCTGSTVRFLAMDGTVVGEVVLQLGSSPGAGCLAEIYGDGAVAVVASPLLSLTRLSSQPRWSALGPYHHDVAFDRGGMLYTLGRRPSVLRRNGREFPIKGQAIVVLDPKGRIRSSIDLDPIFSRFVADDRLASIDRLASKPGTSEQETYAVATDVFHPNSLELVDWPHASGRGRHALLAIRGIDRVAIVDMDHARLVWEWGAGELIGPHDPSLLPNGNVLVFDNGARPTIPISSWRLSSRVVEVDPRTGQIVWQYRSDPPSLFFSASRGGAQPLANGNVLVTESTKGHVFEITRAGEMVWEFWNTDFDADGARRTIYRMHRISDEQFRSLRGVRPPR